MKDKIYNALKQAYSSLGLGDELLLQFAESLEKSGLVTDDNLTKVVEAQKSSFEAIQKMNDKRASDAASKARAKAEEAFKKAKEDEAKEAEKVRTEADENTRTEVETSALQNKKSESDIPEWFKAYQSAQEKKYSEALAKNKELEDSILKIKDENGKFKAEQAAAKRSSFIASEAKRLGVPEWRFKEGFCISDDMDEKSITEYISKVANNIKANSIPEKTSGFPKFDGKATKEEVDKIAENLLNK